MVLQKTGGIMKSILSVLLLVVCANAIASDNSAEPHDHNFVRFHNPETGDWGWADLNDGGLIWYDLPKVAYSYTFFDANDYCAYRGLQTPTMANYELALSRGLLEVYPENIASRKTVFWTSSLYERDHRQGIALVCRRKSAACEFGYGDLENRALVRCVSAR
jgi:formylglycine-generating enzyme required for sulfatase activity